MEWARKRPDQFFQIYSRLLPAPQNPSQQGSGTVINNVVLPAGVTPPGLTIDASND